MGLGRWILCHEKSRILPRQRYQIFSLQWVSFCVLRGLFFKWKFQFMETTGMWSRRLMHMANSKYVSPRAKRIIDIITVFNMAIQLVQNSYLQRLTSVISLSENRRVRKLTPTACNHFLHPWWKFQVLHKYNFGTVNFYETPSSLLWEK